MGHARYSGRDPIVVFGGRHGLALMQGQDRPADWAFFDGPRTVMDWFGEDAAVASTWVCFSGSCLDCDLAGSARPKLVFTLR